MINEVSATRELQKGLRITLNMQEVFFAESTKTEEYRSDPSTDVGKKTTAKANKNKPTEKQATTTEAESVNETFLGGVYRRRGL